MIKVPQGKIVGNKRYIWQCPHPYKKDGECIWCFNGDKDKILDSFKRIKAGTYERLQRSPLWNPTKMEVEAWQ